MFLNRSKLILVLCLFAFAVSSPSFGNGDSDPTTASPFEDPQPGWCWRTILNPMIRTFGSLPGRLVFQAVRYSPLTFVGLNELPKKSKDGKKLGYIFVPNHPGCFDPILQNFIIYKRFRLRSVYLRSMANSMPVLKDLSRAILVPDTHEFAGPTRRAAHAEFKQSLETIGDTLENGESVLLYNEGTISRRYPDFSSKGNMLAEVILANRERGIETRVVLTKMIGMLGSSFGATVGGSEAGPDVAGIQALRMRDLRHNWFFFGPKRPIHIEYNLVDLEELAGIKDPNLSKSQVRTKIRSFLTGYFDDPRLSHNLIVPYRRGQEGVFTLDFTPKELPPINHFYTNPKAVRVRGKVMQFIRRALPEERHPNENWKSRDFRPDERFEDLGFFEEDQIVLLFLINDEFNAKLTSVPRTVGEAVWMAAQSEDL